MSHEVTSSFSEEGEKKLAGPEHFFDGKHDLKTLPQNFSFNEKIIWAFKSFIKWSEASFKPDQIRLYGKEITGNEVSAVFYLNLQGQLDVQDLNVSLSNPLGVKIDVRDFSGLSLKEIEERLKLFAPPGPTISINKEIVRSPQELSSAERRDPENCIFALLPKEFPYEVRKKKIIGVRGLKLLGTVHNHPSMLPLSPGDLGNFFSALRSDDVEPTYSVLGNDGFLYTLVKTATTSTQDIDFDGNLFSQLASYQETIDQEMEEMKKIGMSECEARIKVTIEMCKKHQAGFYVGHIDDNSFTRLV